MSRYLGHGSHVGWKDNGRMNEAMAWFQGDIRVKERGLEGLDLGGSVTEIFERMAGVNSY